jgi:hypothetical protein
MERGKVGERERGNGKQEREQKREGDEGRVCFVFLPHGPDFLIILRHDQLSRQLLMKPIEKYPNLFKKTKSNYLICKLR